MGTKISRKDINPSAPVHCLHLPGVGRIPAACLGCPSAPGELCATLEANRSGCCHRHRLGLIQTGKSRVPIKELNKGPVSDKKEIKLLDCWL